MGPALLVARPIKYKQSNIVSHISDLEDILTMPQHEEKISVLLTVDGGPDWSTALLVNIYFYYGFWRKENLSLLTVTSYVPAFSAYNSIEHLWAPVSKRFTSAKAELLPVLMPKMPMEELIAKEHEVFDRATNEICDYYLKNFRYDGNEISIRRIPCCLLVGDTLETKSSSRPT